MRLLPSFAWVMALVPALVAGGTAAADPAPAAPPDPAGLTNPDGSPVPPNLRHPKTAADYHDLAMFIARITGDYRKSIPYFKRAIALDDNPAYECNLAAALGQIDEGARADALYNRCIPQLGDADATAELRGVQADLQAELKKTHAAVSITTAPSGASVIVSAWPSDEPVIAPIAVWLRPGSYTLTAHLAGHPDVTESVTVTPDDVAAHRLVPVSIALGREAPRPRSKRPAILTLSAGGALVLGGGVVHFLSRDVRATLAGKSGDDYRAYLSTWHAYQYSTIGLYAAGAVTLAVGAYLYSRERTPAPIAVVPTDDGAGAMLWLWSP